MTPPPIDRALARTFPNWWSKDTFDAVDHVSFELARGTALGLIGHNGAGKTTLLKLLSRVTDPTAGTIATAGRVAAILDVTVGFHPELTGRENLFLVGNMYGLSRRDILSRQDRILGFAELGDLIDTPVKRYSAGMVARLGFATIAAVEADVILVDEVLAVGDASFQRKCIEWLEGFRNRGGTLLFVSHNLGLIRHMTDRALWLHRGQIRLDGPTPRVLSEYARAADERRSGEDRSGLRGARKMMRASGLDRWGVGGIRVSSAEVLQPEDADGRVDVEIRYEATDPGEDARFSVGFIDEAGYELGASLSPEFRVRATEGLLRWRIDNLPLRTGVYYPVLCVLSANGAVLDRWKLDRPIVLERGGDDGLSSDLGATDFGGVWREGVLDPDTRNPLSAPDGTASVAQGGSVQR